ETAAGRLRLFHALAADQEPLRESAAEAGAAQRRSRRTQRTRHLAAPILGASDPRRGRLCASRRILLCKPAQAPTRHPRARLALLLIPPRRTRGAISGRLGWRQRNGR